MKTICFFDDWMLDARQDIAREFGTPRPDDREIVFDDGEAPPLGGYMNVIRDPDSGLYRLWYTVSGQREIAGKNYNTFLCYAESKDGFVWTRPDLGFYPELKNQVGIDHLPTVTYKVTRDPFDPDPQRRYKFVAMDIIGNIYDNNIHGLIYVSPDGLDWKLVEGARWYAGRMGSDCDNNLFYNPITKRYQVICRPSCLDRRVAIVESDDMIHWTDPAVVLHPDALDEPLLQLYSMTPLWYHDHFVAAMQVQRISSSERSGCKWFGRVHDELVYSYNGTHWNRTDRSPLLPRLELDQPGSLQVYTNSIVEQEDGALRFYSGGSAFEHFAAHTPEEIELVGKPLVHTLRQDGFAYLQPRAGYGTFSTRGLIPRNGDLRINFSAPYGRVWVQASNAAHEPFPGFTFEDSIPLAGDDVAGRPTWKGGKTIDQFVNEWVRLEFRLYQARVYAIHWDFRIQYGDAPIDRI